MGPRQNARQFIVACCAAAATAGPLPALVTPEDPPAVAALEFRHSDLSFRNAYRSLDELPAGAAALAQGDLAELGGEAGTARLDVRGGRWGTLILAVPLIPGSGTGNDLRWEGFGARPADPAGLEDAVRQAFLEFLARHAAALRVTLEELAPARVAVHRGGELVQIHAPRRVGGVPVRDSYLTAIVSHGNLVLFGAETWGDLEIPVRPRLTAAEALDAAAAFLAPHPVEGWSKPALELVPSANGPALEEIAVGDGYRHRLAWVVRPRFADGSAAGGGERWELLVDAHSGEVLAFEDTYSFASQRRVTGGVYPVSNDGRVPDGVEYAGWPMPFETVQTPSGPFTTDSGGNLPVPVDGDITADLDGLFVRMNDRCGEILLTSPGDLDFATSGGDDCVTPGVGGAGNTHASRSGFFELNRIMEQARGYLPNNAWLQRRLTATMNINSSCNAFWNGATVNFYRSGGGCANTGELAAVSDHEWGHGMDNNDVNPSISRPGEGIADAYAYLRLDDSCIGRNFRSGNCGGCLSCSGVREIDWGRHVSGQPHDVAWIDANCGGGSAPCGGGVHCEGRVYAEAIFDLVNRDLPAFYGLDHNTALELGTRLTYLGAGPVGSWYQCITPYGGCAASGGYLNYLAADDDNGDLGDGTPHMAAIFSAFDRHGIACDTPAVQDGGCANTPATAPAVAAAAFDRGVTLSWGAVPGASGYQVFRTDGVFGCDFGKTKVGETAGTSFTDGGLQNGREHFYVVIPMGGTGACTGPASACTAVTPQPGPRLAIDGSSAVLTPTSGDGDPFLDNCERATWSFTVENAGLGSHTDLRLVGVTASNPGISIDTPLPAPIAPVLAESASVSASFGLTGGGLSSGETVTFLVEVTSAELEPETAAATFTAELAESDLLRIASRTFDFETGDDGWQVVAGTFGRSGTDGGAGGSAWFLASSDNLAQQCDQVRSPPVLLTADSTLELWNRFDVEPIFQGTTWYDRANVGIVDAETGDRTPVDPDGGRLYNAAGARGTCGTTGQAGWADQALTWDASTWSSAALGGGALAGRPVHLDVRYGTDQFLQGFGFRFDRVTLTEFEEIVPDGQADVCTCEVDADCVDSLYCNGVESCVDNVCRPGTPVDCDDGVACTVDACDDAADACASTPSDLLCSNGVFCDGAETCDPTLGCRPAPAPVDCDDGVACTSDVCDEDLGACDNAPNHAVCSNGVFCDGAEVCDPALDCQPGPPTDCDDGVGCTADACDEDAGACVHAPDDGLCSNGLFCDGVEVCDPALDCRPGGAPCTYGCDEAGDACIDPVPFACGGDAFIIHNENAELARVDRSASPVELAPVGGPTGTELNSLGFRSTDGLLYALELSSAGNVQVVAIDADATVFGLGRPPGLPPEARFDAGDVAPDGSTMYLITHNQPLYRLDLTALPSMPPVTSVAVSGSIGFVFDWAVNPADGKLYGGDSSHGQLAVLDPATGARTDLAVAGLPAGAGYGGAWFDAAGHLFLYQNDGNLYEIDLAGPTVVATQSGPGASRNDGAACAP